MLERRGAFRLTAARDVDTVCMSQHGNKVPWLRIKRGAPRTTRNEIEKVASTFDRGGGDNVELAELASSVFIGLVVATL